MASRTPSRATSLIALLAVTFLLATACSDDSEPPLTSEAPDVDNTTTTVAADGPPSESAAASLRSNLTALLEEQVYLTGFTIEDAAAAGGDLDVPDAAAMAEAAATSATELSDTVGAAYGVVVGVDFNEAWDAHQASLVDVALEDGAPEAVTTARDAVVGVVEEADPEADLATFAAALEASDGEMLTTVDELVAGTPAAAVDLRAAADEMPEAALGLAEAIASHSLLEGEVDSPESALRADLTGLMQESALLTGLGLSEIVQADGDDAAVAPVGVFTAVDENTVALAEAMIPDDQAQRDAFGETWGSHIAAFQDYLTSVLDDDAAGIQLADDAIVTFRDDLGQILADTYPAFTKEAVAEELVPHTDSIVAYADALVAESLGADVIESPTALRAAAQAMVLAARYFAGGLTAPTG